MIKDKSVVSMCKRKNNIWLWLYEWFGFCELGTYDKKTEKEYISHDNIRY